MDINHYRKMKKKKKNSVNPDKQQLGIMAVIATPS